MNPGQRPLSQILTEYRPLIMSRAYKLADITGDLEESEEEFRLVVFKIWQENKEHDEERFASLVKASVDNKLIDLIRKTQTWQYLRVDEGTPSLQDPIGEDGLTLGDVTPAHEDKVGKVVVHEIAELIGRKVSEFTKSVFEQLLQPDADMQRILLRDKKWTQRDYNMLTANQLAERFGVSQKTVLRAQEEIKRVIEAYYKK